MNGIESIAAERTRQIEVEGWTSAHDDANDLHQLAVAAACYALSAAGWSFIVDVWPRTWSRSWFKPKDKRADLVRAGALIAAEIDRIDRKKAST